MTETMDAPRFSQHIQGTYDQFPPEFSWPWPVLIREANKVYADAIAKGPLSINIPRYGVLYLDGRKYRFEFDSKYAARKGYDSVREGTWG